MINQEELVVVTEGEYEDYHIIGIYVTPRPVDEKKIFQEWTATQKATLDYYDKLAYRSKGFVDWATEHGYLKPVTHQEIWIGDGEFFSDEGLPYRR